MTRPCLCLYTQMHTAHYSNNSTRLHCPWPNKTDEVGCFKQYPLEELLWDTCPTAGKSSLHSVIQDRPTFCFHWLVRGLPTTAFLNPEILCPVSFPTAQFSLNVLIISSKPSSSPPIRETPSVRLALNASSPTSSGLQIFKGMVNSPLRQQQMDPEVPWPWDIRCSSSINSLGWFKCNKAFLMD